MTVLAETANSVTVEVTEYGYSFASCGVNYSIRLLGEIAACILEMLNALMLVLTMVNKK